MKRLVVLLVILLALLHQDFWFWNRIDPMLLGFLPVGLTYHMIISIAAALVGALAVKYCWPHDLDALADLPEAPQQESHARGDRE